MYLDLVTSDSLVTLAGMEDVLSSGVVGSSELTHWSDSEEGPGGCLQAELTPGTGSLGGLAGGCALEPSSLREQFFPTLPRCHSLPHPVLFFQSLTIYCSYLICRSLLSVAVISGTTKSKLEVLFQLTGYSPSLREAKAGVPGKN